jgi:hypothetical protein
MTDLDTRLADANALREEDLDGDDPDLSLDGIWGAVARHDERNPTSRADHQRRRRRHRLLRTTAITVGALAALTGTALGAGSALGIIDLGGGVSATPVTTLPVWNGSTGTFDSGTANGQYIYELSGLGADTFVCGPATPDVATFLTSTQPLTQSDLESLLDPSNPSGLNPQVNQAALGITSESGGCFPTSVADPLGTPQTPSERAAAEAWTQQVISQVKGQGTANTRRAAAAPQLAHAPRLRYVTVIHDGRRTIVKLSRASHTLATSNARQLRLARQAEQSRPDCRSLADHPLARQWCKLKATSRPADG